MTNHTGTLLEVRDRFSFLIDRLGEYTPDDDGNCREYYGHVEPAIEVARNTLAKLDTFLAAVPEGLGASLKDIADINIDYAEADLMLEEGSLQKSISAAALLHEATKGE